MKKLLLLIVLFVLVGCTSTPEKHEKILLPGATLKDVTETLESLELNIIKTPEAPDPNKTGMISWRGEKNIQTETSKIRILCDIFGYSENEICSIYVSVIMRGNNGAFSKSDLERFETETLKILPCVGRIPFEGVNGADVGKWVENTLKTPIGESANSRNKVNGIVYSISGSKDNSKHAPSQNKGISINYDTPHD